MIEISVKIDNVAVEGISPSSVKLTINNADPLKFTDRTVAYSASISVPRTEVNDRIFKEMRTPWLFTKSKMYVAYLYFGGLPAPMTSIYLSFLSIFSTFSNKSIFPLIIARGVLISWVN